MYSSDRVGFLTGQTVWLACSGLVLWGAGALTVKLYYSVWLSGLFVTYGLTAGNMTRNSRRKVLLLAGVGSAVFTLIAGLRIGRLLG